MLTRALLVCSVLASLCFHAPAARGVQAETPKVESKPDPAKAAEAKKRFDELFGEEVTRVNATADPADDIELAGQLLSAARGADDTPAIRDLLCDQAFALASKDPSGYATAAEVMKLVIEKNPSQKEAAEAKVAAMYHRGYERATGDKKTAAGQQYVDYLVTDADAKIVGKDYNGALTLLRRAKPIAIVIKSDDKDTIQSRIDQYTLLAATQTKIEAAEKKLKSNPWDKTSHTQLLDLYLTDMDSPASAAKHVEIGGDETQKKLIPWAAKPVDDLNETQALELAGWYEGLGKKGTTATKIAMLNRSRSYYDRYLAAHLTEDVQRTAASLAQKRVTDIIAKLESESGGVKAAAVDSKVIDLLTPIDPSRDTRNGKWIKSVDALVNDRERGRGGPPGLFNSELIESPVKIDGNYNVKIKFTKTSGRGAPVFVLPVADTRVTFALNMVNFGGTGELAGLSDVAGKNLFENETRREGAIQEDRAYLLDAVVKIETDGNASIAITLDGKPYLTWKGKKSDLKASDLTRLSGEKTMGFGIIDGSISIAQAKLKMLTGKADATAKGSAPEKVAARDEKSRDEKSREEDRRRDDFRRRFEDFRKNFR